jgi:hypothetical protein
VGGAVGVGEMGEDPSPPLLPIASPRMLIALADHPVEITLGRFLDSCS